MKILITGAAGQLGQELRHQLAQGKCSLGRLPLALRDAHVAEVDIEQCNISSREQTLQVFSAFAPDVVLHCAAFTAVDACEKEVDKAFAANALGARNVAMACRALDAKLVHVSTDYVFDGQGSTPFAESYPTAPKSVYGQTKLLGEDYVRRFCGRSFVVRTSWLYSHYGDNFVKTISKVAREKGNIKVVNDQLGNPTNAEDLAFHMLKLAASKEYGLYHCTGQGICSWYDFACEIVRLAKISATVMPCTTAEFPRPAKRPSFSALDNMMLRHTVGDEMRPWQDALADFLEDEKALGN